MRLEKYKRAGGALMVAAIAVGLPIGLAASPAAAADGDIAITEVNPRASDTPLGLDWIELTNTGSSPINLTGWRFDDDSNNFASAGVISGVTSIAPGEAIILVAEGTSGSPAAYKNQWWGAAPPAGQQVGWIAGSGLGLSSGGDGGNVFNSAGTRVALVTYGSTAGSAPFKTLDNTAGIDGAITLRSAVGTNGAFTSAQGSEIGSPGVRTGPAPVVPEFPATALAGLTGAAVIGGVLILRRRKDAGLSVA